jgi:hypothetical protein
MGLGRRSTTDRTDCTVRTDKTTGGLIWIVETHVPKAGHGAPSSVASNSFGFAVGDVFGVEFGGAVGEGDFAAVCGGDGVVEHFPVF